jgi:peptide/nickel transport system permease protein
MGLKEYVTRRASHLVVTYWAFITTLFLLFRLLPGDPTTLYLQSGMTPEERQRTLERLGLDEPLHQQYIDYILNLMTGDLGWSFRHKTEVIDVLATKFWNTIFLMGAAIILAYIIGVVVGALLGWWRGTRNEKMGLIGVLIARSSPQFWTGIVMLMIFVFWLNWFPSGRMRAIGVIVDGFWDKYLAWDFVYHMVLPLATATLYYMTMPILVMRSGMVNILTSDFIEIKKAEGLPEWTILYKHAARNSVLPVVTIAAVTSGVAIGGSLVIETVFNWPGMGREMVEAVNFNDYPMAMGAFFLMGSFVIMMNFVADLLYVYLDPRVTYEGEK